MADQGQRSPRHHVLQALTENKGFSGPFRVTRVTFGEWAFSSLWQRKLRKLPFRFAGACAQPFGRIPGRSASGKGTAAARRTTASWQVSTSSTYFPLAFVGRRRRSCRLRRLCAFASLRETSRRDSRQDAKTQRLGTPASNRLRHAGPNPASPFFAVPGHGESRPRIKSGVTALAARALLARGVVAELVRGQLEAEQE